MNTLFYNDDSNYFKKRVSLNYMEVFRVGYELLYNGCIDWRWSYKYNYPPLLNDLIRFVPSFDSKMIKDNNHKPVSRKVQLSYVLPPESLAFNSKYRNKTTNKISSFL